MSSEAGEGTGLPGLPSVAPGDRAPIGLRVQGRYRVVSELGAGTFGNVVLAEDEATGHRVAIRFLPGGLAGAPHGAIIAASTAYPGLTRVLEFGEIEKGRPFVVMEYVEGRRLSEVLSEGKPLDIGAALRLALDLGGSVEALHNAGLVHGALRPCNVMVLEDGRVKLMDLELAGLRDAEWMGGALAAEPPAEYLSPEQIRRGPVTEKTDIYAFAVVLYAVLCGVPPFQATTREAVLAGHLTGTPAPMRRRRRAVSLAVESVVALALSKRPERRPLMQDVLNRLWEEANGPTTGWKRWAALMGGAALAASIAALAVWGFVASRPPAPLPLPLPQPPVSTPTPSAAPATKRATVPADGPPVRVVVPPAARATPPSSPPVASGDADPYDPGAVIDWLLNSSSGRGQ